MTESSVQPMSARFGRRVKRPGSGRIPVTIFTGFLGAGKTSLIRRLIETPQGADTLIIVNEFGEIGFDQYVLSETGERAILLGNGCLCCSVRTDLQETLRSFFVAKMKGTETFRQVIIETSGLADPSPLLQTFMTDRALAKEFHLRGLFSVVDAVNFPKEANDHPLAQKQVALSDCLIVSKCDVASSEEIRETRERLSSALAGRSIPILRADEIDVETLLVHEVDAVAGKLDRIAEAVNHDADISAFPIFFDQPLVWEAFVQAIRALIELRGPDLLRIKGLLAIENCEGPVVFHAVQHLVHDPVELSAWPDDDHRSRLIFITRRIDPLQIKQLISAMTGLVPIADDGPRRA